MNRHYAQTKLNHKSSRSHTVFRLVVQSVTNKFIRSYRKQQQLESVKLSAAVPNLQQAGSRRSAGNVNNSELINSLGALCGEDKGGAVVTESELNFVDLAGSEKISNHHTQSTCEQLSAAAGGGGGSGHNEQHYLGEQLSGDYQQQQVSILNASSIYNNNNNVSSQSVVPPAQVAQRVREGLHINKSLFFLTQVIMMRAEGSQQHIPYRNSPLTKILKSSLGGNSRTLVVLCASAAKSHCEQTLSTMRFGTSAKKIENRIQVNIQAKSNEEALRLLITDYEKRLADLESAKNTDKERIRFLKSEIESLYVNEQTLKKNLLRAHNLAIRSNGARKSSAGSQQQPQSSLLAFYKNQAMQHLESSGLLFLTKQSKLQQNMSVPGDQYVLRQNWQQLIFDFQGRYALEGLQLAKEHTRHYQSCVKKYQALVALSNTHLKKAAEQLYFLATEQNIKLQQQERHYKQYQELFERAQRAVQRVQLLENLEGVADLTDRELEDLERKVDRTLNQLKDEKARRKYQKQVTQLTLQLQQGKGMTANQDKATPSLAQQQGVQKNSSNCTSITAMLLSSFAIEHSQLVSALDIEKAQNSVQVSLCELQERQAALQAEVSNGKCKEIEVDLSKFEDLFVKNHTQNGKTQLSDYAELELLRPQETAAELNYSHDSAKSQIDVLETNVLNNNSSLITLADFASTPISQRSAELIIRGEEESQNISCPENIQYFSPEKVCNRSTNAPLLLQGRAQPEQDSIFDFGDSSYNYEYQSCYQGEQKAHRDRSFTSIHPKQEKLSAADSPVAYSQKTQQQLVEEFKLYSNHQAKNSLKTTPTKYRSPSCQQKQEQYQHATSIIQQNSASADKKKRSASSQKHSNNKQAATNSKQVYTTPTKKGKHTCLSQSNSNVSSPLASRYSCSQQASYGGAQVAKRQLNQNSITSSPDLVNQTMDNQIQSNQVLKTSNKLIQQNSGDKVQQASSQATQQQQQQPCSDALINTFSSDCKKPQQQQISANGTKVGSQKKYDRSLQSLLKNVESKLFKRFQEQQKNDF